MEWKERAKMNLDDVYREELIFRLGYNMGIVIRYRSLLKDSVKILAHLQVSNSDIVELNEKILAALLDEDLKLTQSLDNKIDIDTGFDMAECKRIIKEEQ